MINVEEMSYSETTDHAFPELVSAYILGV